MLQSSGGEVVSVVHIGVRFDNVLFRACDDSADVRACGLVGCSTEYRNFIFPFVVLDGVMCGHFCPVQHGVHNKECYNPGQAASGQ